MARARNIKPGFFTNDNLADINPLGRLLFIGLWTICDRSGRLEDRHRKIKAEVLPYDDCDADELLSELEKHGFILRYTSGDDRYIQVLNFNKHQNPHVKESASTIPAPDMHGADSVQEQNEHTTNPADSLLLNPDSLIPITESNENASVPESSGAVEGKKTKATAKLKEVEIPDWLDANAWQMWDQFRKTKSARAWTPQAQVLSLKSLEKLKASGHDPTAVIEQSIERGWTGLFEIKAQTTGRPSAHTGFAKQDYHKGVAADGTF